MEFQAATVSSREQGSAAPETAFETVQCVLFLHSDTSAGQHMWEGAHTDHPCPRWGV